MTARPMLGRRKLRSAVPAVALAPARANAQQRNITLATAAEGGAFIVYGQVLVDVLRSVDAVLEIRSRPSKGSGENVRLLEAGEVDIALVAGEVAQEVFPGINRPIPNLPLTTRINSPPPLFLFPP